MFPVDRMMIPRRMAFTVWKAPSEVKMIRAALYRTGNLRKLTENDYWITDPEAAGFGVITGKKPEGLLATQFVNLEAMRAFSNFGMILKPEEGAEGYPALVVNCQQSGSKNRSLCGIQLAQSYVRMLIQSMDSGTRSMIA